MSLLIQKSANIVGAAPQGAYLKHLTVEGTLTLRGNCPTPTDPTCACCFQAQGSAISSVPPQAPTPTRYWSFVVDGVAYKAPAYENIVIT